MAVFAQNICKFDNCNRIFPELPDLILHIEDTHIDKEPEKLREREAEKSLQLPMSYVQKYYSSEEKRQHQIADIRKRMATNEYITTGGEEGPGIPDAADSDDSTNSTNSWTYPDAASKKYILKYGTRRTTGSSGKPIKKPFVCPVSGCLKKYKNLNGIKYHSENGHLDERIRKKFRCECGKKYKSKLGLKGHATATGHKEVKSKESEESESKIVKLDIPSELETHDEIAENTDLYNFCVQMTCGITDPDEVTENITDVVPVSPQKEVLGTQKENNLDTNYVGPLTPVTSPDSNSDGFTSSEFGR